MTRQEMAVTLSNALILLNLVETKGEKNLNALLKAIQDIRAVSKSLKEEPDENHYKQRDDG